VRAPLARRKRKLSVTPPERFARPARFIHGRGIAVSRLPWRMVVLSDLGVDAVRPEPVTSEALDGWFDSLGLAASPATLTPAALLAAGVPAERWDGLLHDPPAQRIEAAWRGLAFLLEHAGGAVRVEAMSARRGSLAERFRSAVHAPELTSAEPATLVVLDYDFTHKAADLALLGELAGMAAEIQAPIIANAGAGFFDLRYLVQAGAVQDIATRVSDAAHAGWQAFQKNEDARWVCLTLNRYLLREPWNADDFRESCSESNPESYLWGRGVWLVAAAIARSVREHGHALELSGAGGRFDGMPTRPYPVLANESRALATEAPIPETALLELTHAAFTAISGGFDRATVTIPTIVTAHRYGTSRLTVEGTLAYQLTAARVALVCGITAAALDGSAGGESVRTELARRLREDLGALLGDSPEALAIEIVEAQGDVPRHAAVTVRPPILVEGKSPRFDVEVGLES
jgi:hypothetical protein